MAKGNTLSTGQIRPKPFREALNMEIAEASGDPKRLRRIAVAFLDKCESGDTAAIKELADRLDGKVPQGIGGSDELPPIQTEELTDEDTMRRVAHIANKALLAREQGKTKK